MSKARPPIPENIKVALLRETNYRCGYCMMNITPAAYFTENRDKTDERVKKFVEDFNQKNKLAAEGSASILTIAEVNDLLPTYYQMYECAHIEPYNEEDPATNSFYNLIALCKNCHWKTEPKHSNAIITKEQLKALKLHWMIASGRFTRLEIDLLMDLYNEYRNYYELYPLCANGLDFCLKESSDIKLTPSVSYIPYRSQPCDPSNRIIKDGPIESGNKKCYSFMFESNYYMSFIFRNILISKFAVHTQDWPVIGAQGRQMYVLPGYITITRLGFNFCKNFHEAYQELDKIEI